MLKQFNIEYVVVILCLIFAIVICQYHLSYNGYLSITKEQWDIIWSISENFSSLIMCTIIVLFTYGWIKNIFKWTFIPYFIVKLIYHFSCFAQVFILSKEMWDLLWSCICTLMIVIGLIYVLVIFRRKKL